MKRVCQAVLRLSGIRLIRELLAWASSVMDTLPLCLMNRATESSSSGVMEMNFPLSSITPASNIQYVIIQDTVVIYEDSWCHNDRYTIQSLYYKNYLYTHIFVFLSLLLQTLSVYHFFHFLLFHLLKCCCLCLGPQIILVSIRQQSVNSDFLSGLFVSFAISPQN